MSASLIDYRVTDRRIFANGKIFGETGSYERLKGRVIFRVDPTAPGVRDVTDIELAPVDETSRVRFEADFCILRPLDPHKGNGRLFYDYGNRGDKRALQFFNAAKGSNDPIEEAHAGDGYLMRRGYTIVWLGWQGDLLPGDGRLLLKVPVATHDGTPITGTLCTEFVASEAGHHEMPLSTLASTRSYPAVSLDTKRATLTRRLYAHTQRERIAPDAWAFARLERGGSVDSKKTDTALIPSDSNIYLHDGFEPGWIYELIYEAVDPLVLGLGHVAVRDFISFLKKGAAQAKEQPPLTTRPFEKAYAWGRSQTGRCIRDFIYLGFNDDGQGNRVFDGVMPHVAGAGKMWMNHRFANMTLLPGQEHENHFSPVDSFPYSYARSTDHLTGVEDAILKRPETDPLVIHTDTSCEYWHRRASLVHTDTRGEDLKQPDGVRLYFWASSQHFADPLLTAPSAALGQTMCNVVATHYFFRAVLDRLDEWATDGVAPPPSLYPSRAQGTLVTVEEWRSAFPTIPGVALPQGPSRLEHLDFGPEFSRTGTISAQARIVSDQKYAVLVPAVDGDGNDQGGLRAPMAAAPLGTYTGWSLRRRDVGHGAMVGITGSYIPFPDTDEERSQTGDPRTSILSRFADSTAYENAIRDAAEKLCEQGYMLECDIANTVALAQDWGRPRHLTRLPVSTVPRNAANGDTKT
ncbi:hypothetical protein I5535_11985 [Rhodobacteraceae bacterium F11138]|nr:hypothetical protein [Rhodobacteraceae bacterium F11138]